MQLNKAVGDRIIYVTLIYRGGGGSVSERTYNGQYNNKVIAAIANYMDNNEITALSRK